MSPVIGTKIPAMNTTLRPIVLPTEPDALSPLSKTNDRQRAGLFGASRTDTDPPERGEISRMDWVPSREGGYNNVVPVGTGSPGLK